MTDLSGDAEVGDTSEAQDVETRKWAVETAIQCVRALHFTRSEEKMMTLADRIYNYAKGIDA